MCAQKRIQVAKVKRRCGERRSHSGRQVSSAQTSSAAITGRHGNCRGLMCGASASRSRGSAPDCVGDVCARAPGARATVEGKRESVQCIVQQLQAHMVKHEIRCFLLPSIFIFITTNTNQRGSRVPPQTTLRFSKSIMQVFERTC